MAMPGPYAAVIQSVVKACISKDPISQAEAIDSLERLRSEPESRDLAHVLELILKGARVRGRLLVMVDRPEDIAMIRDVLKLIEGEAEFHLDFAIVNGSRKFNAREKTTIKILMSNQIPENLTGLRMIRAENSAEKWLGRYHGDQGLIELNQGWTNGTLLHEFGHLMFDRLSAEQKEEWETLHARSKDPSDFVS
jgi:hypothetical protein